MLPRPFSLLDIIRVEKDTVAFPLLARYIMQAHTVGYEDAGDGAANRAIRMSVCPGSGGCGGIFLIGTVCALTVGQKHPMGCVAWVLSTHSEADKSTPIANGGCKSIIKRLLAGICWAPVRSPAVAGGEDLGRREAVAPGHLRAKRFS